MGAPAAEPAGRAAAAVAAPAPVPVQPPQPAPAPIAPEPAAAPLVRASGGDPAPAAAPASAAATRSLGSEAPRAASVRRTEAKRPAPKVRAFAAAPVVKRYSKKRSKLMRKFCARSGRGTPECRVFARSAAAAQRRSKRD
jgi:hypothetical protein